MAGRRPRLPAEAPRAGGGAKPPAQRSPLGLAARARRRQTPPPPASHRPKMAPVPRTAGNRPCACAKSGHPLPPRAPGRGGSREASGGAAARGRRAGAGPQPLPRPPPPPASSRCRCFQQLRVCRNRGQMLATGRWHCSLLANRVWLNCHNLENGFLFPLPKHFLFIFFFLENTLILAS